MREKIVAVSVGMYVVVYVFVPAVQALINMTIGNATSGLGASVRIMAITVLPALAVIGIALLFIPRK